MNMLEATWLRGLGFVFCLAFAPCLCAVDLKDFPVRADAGMLASADVRSNAFVEGTTQGSMSNYFWIVYWPFNWVRTTSRIGSNGLFRIDYIVYQRDRGSPPVKPSLSVLFFRPPGREPDNSSPSNTTVADLDEQLEWQERKIRGVPPLSRRSERALWAIEEALNGAQFFSANADRYQFSGTNGSFTFVSQLPESFLGVMESGGAGPQRVRVFLEGEGRDKNSLVLEHTPLLLNGYVDPYRIILARHAGTFFGWYYFDGAQRVWTNSWTATGAMPAQVSLSLAIFSRDELTGGSALREFPDRLYSLPCTAVSPDWQVPVLTNAPPPSLTNNPHGFAPSATLDARPAASATAIQKRSRRWPLRAEKHAVELEWLGRSGVELARYILSGESHGQYDALNQKWAGGVGDSNSPLARIPMQNFPLGGGTISLRMVDLDRRFNINVGLLEPEIVFAALQFAGVEPSEAPSIVEAIQDWQDADDMPRTNGVESAYYLMLDPPHAAKNGPFDDVAELLLVKGVTPRMFFGSTNAGERAVGLRDLLTTVSGRFININTASPEVMQLLPEVDSNLAQAIVSTRAGPDGIEGNEDDMPFRSIGELSNVPGMTPQLAQMFARYFGTRSSTFEATVDVKLGHQTRQYSAWLRRTGGNNAQILKLHRTK